MKIHDSIVNVMGSSKFTDKQLHFITIEIIGAIIFGIEIEQKLTQRGNMEFNDILQAYTLHILICHIYFHKTCYIFYKEICI